MTEQPSGLNTADGPNFGPRLDPAALKALVEQQAVVDAQSGAYDTDMLRAHEGPLPSEKYISALVDRLIEENALHAFDAKGLDIGLAAGADPLVPLTGLADALESRGGLEAKLEDIEEALAATQREYEETCDVLRGESTWRDGGSSVGAIPPTPVVSDEAATSKKKTQRELSKRPEARTRRFVDWQATVLSALPEFGVLSAILPFALGMTFNFEVAMIALAVMICAVGAPHFIGIFLSRAAKGATRRRLAWVVALPLTALWLLVVAQVANLRVDADRGRALREAAIAQGVTLAEADITGTFDEFGAWLLWASLLLAVGGVIIWLKMIAYNPALTSVIALQRELVLLKLDQVTTTAKLARLDEIDAQRAELRAAQEEIAQNTAEQFEAMPAMLDQLRHELITYYRTVFIDALATPSATGYLAID